MEFVQGRDLPEYEQDRMLRRAVERELSIVGEAVSQGTRRFPNLEESIGPARQIVAFRNRIIYGYGDIDSSIVWAIVQNEVPRLLGKSEAILEEEPQGGQARSRASSHTVEVCRTS